MCSKQVKHGYAHRAKITNSVAHVNIIVHCWFRRISYEDIHCVTKDTSWVVLNEYDLHTFGAEIGKVSYTSCAGMI